MKENYTKIIAIIFTVIILGISILFFVIPKTEYSENENRYLQKLPSFSFSLLFAGEYIPKLESYFTDHFLIRDAFVSVKTIYEKVTLKDEINGIYIGKNGYLIEEYKGLNNSEQLKELINNFSNKINHLNINLMLVPTSITINEDSLPNPNLASNQLEDITNIYNGVNINTIDISSLLSRNNETMPMFYYSDHHWTTYGAYCGYLAFAKANNIDYLELDKFEVKEITNSFNGTLYSKSGDYLGHTDKIYSFVTDNEYEVNYVFENIIKNTMYEDKYLTEKDKYSYFLDNNHALIVITNKSIKNNNEIVVIKDSYANSLIPFLTNHYKKVHVIDPRYYSEEISEYILNNKDIKDVLILYNINTIGSDTGILTLR